MFSMKIIYQILIVFLSASLIIICRTAPAVENGSSSSSNNNNAASGQQQLGDVEDIVYDQRQNGSENLRIHMNDVTLVIAPSEGILQLMGASAADLLSNGDVSGPGGSSNGNGNPNGNKPSASSGGPSLYSISSDCATDPIAKCKQQSHKKNRLRLSSLLVPLLNRAAGNK